LQGNPLISLTEQQARQLQIRHEQLEFLYVERTQEHDTEKAAMIKDHGEQVAKSVRFHNEERAARSTKFLGTISDQRAERERVRKPRRKLWTNSYDEDVGYSDSNDGDSSSSERVTVRTHRCERSMERNTPYISQREDTRLIGCLRHLFKGY
jgi:hypothetical protein